MRAARHVQQALFRAEYRPHQGKMPEGWTSSQGVRSDRCCRFSPAKPFIEIIARQGDRQAGERHDANAQPAQGAAQLRCTLHIDRLNAYTAVAEILLGGVRRQTEARPVGGHRAGRRGRCRHHIAPVDQPFHGFVDLVGGKIPLQRANDLSKGLPALSGLRRPGTIELTVKKELAVLGIEAHDIGRQHVNSEIRRELRNVSAVMLGRADSPIACHELGTRTSPRRHCKACCPLARAPS